MAEYDNWLWEQTLAAVLAVQLPDRAQISGARWLYLVTGDAGPSSSGDILVFSGSLQGDDPLSPAINIRVYLDSAFDPVWHQYADTPGNRLADPVGSQVYTSIALSPPTFTDVAASLASMADWFGGTATTMHTRWTSIDTGGEFRGSAAAAFQSLLRQLDQLLRSLETQMRTAHGISYASTVEDSGGAAGDFIASIWGAYQRWLDVLEHAPHDAVVSVLQEVAQSGGGIDRQTRYGDITTPAAWAAIEAEAKRRWSVALGDLDVASRAALSALANQYTASIGVLTPLPPPGLSANNPPIPGVTNVLLTTDPPPLVVVPPPGGSGVPTNVVVTDQHTGGPTTPQFGDPGVSVGAEHQVNTSTTFITVSTGPGSGALGAPVPPPPLFTLPFTLSTPGSGGARGTRGAGVLGPGVAIGATGNTGAASRQSRVRQIQVQVVIDTAPDEQSGVLGRIDQIGTVPPDAPAQDGDAPGLAPGSATAGEPARIQVPGGTSSLVAGPGAPPGTAAGPSVVPVPGVLPGTGVGLGVGGRRKSADRARLSWRPEIEQAWGTGMGPERVLGRLTSDGESAEDEPDEDQVEGGEPDQEGRADVFDGGVLGRPRNWDRDSEEGAGDDRPDIRAD